MNIKIWARLLPYLKNLKKPLIIGFITMLVSSAIEGAYPLFTRYAVDKFVTPGTTRGIGAFALAFFALILVNGVAAIAWSRNSMVIEMRLGPALKRDCFVHLQELPLSYYNQNSVGYLISRVMSDTDRIAGLISWGVMQLLGSTFYTIGSFVYMFALNARLALVLLAVLPVAALVTWLLQKKLLVVNRRVRDVNSRISGAYNEGITGAKTSKTLVIEDRNSVEFGELTAGMYRESVRAARLQALLMQLMLIIGSVAVGVVLLRGGYLVADDMLAYGVLAAFITYAISIIDQISEISRILSDSLSAQACVERVAALLDEPRTVTDTPEVEAKYGGVFDPKRENWEPLAGRVTFENVWFKYPDGDDYILEDFSLDVPAGSTVAIVGETGAGKSTIVNLVCRFYEPTSGRVLLDGRDARERSLLWLHSSLGYVLQDPHLFSGTILDNIRYGKLGASDEEVTAAARLVSADGIAERLRDGYLTEVGEGGDMLSTGEKQLISFARAVIANPPLFVLDEATSSIDTETEKLIQDAISHILNGRTSFIIAHRLSTISRADLILVVDDGKIVERGTHSELLAQGGHYSALYTAMRIDEESAGL
ncbi:MAG: ABC transporter ATP-binding protein/permease [Oscillospiraceae bacterium]|jgi:ATP-binding cassette subfamily B protein|nr:ABC transporter ATP-binding protein/permease [Oscillospiraceae bacterium]